MDEPSDANTAPGKVRAWWSRQRDDLLRDALVAVLCGALLLVAAVWFDDRREDRAQDLANQQAERAEVLENTRFIRQVAIDPAAKVKPFYRLNLHEASLARLPLGCPQNVEPRDVSSGCADLTEANLKSADLNGADLNGANLNGSDLTGANLIGADLTDADLSYADLTDADLNDATLTGADLTHAKLIDADLSHAKLKTADLTDADLTYAKLMEANLSDATLTNAKLIDAKLDKTNLSRVNLLNADLRGKLYKADLTSAVLTGVCYDVTTVWPEQFEPPKASDC